MNLVKNFKIDCSHLLFCALENKSTYKIVKSVCVKREICVYLIAQLYLTLCYLWTVAHQGPLPIGFSRPEYWSGEPFQSPGDLPDPETEPKSPAVEANSLLSVTLGKRYQEREYLLKVNSFPATYLQFSLQTYSLFFTFLRP